MSSGLVLSVNVGRPAELRTPKRVVMSSIVKYPVAGQVAARGVNLDGDEQADKANHGDFSKAVYAYAREDAAWWEEVIGRPLGPAAFGENLTVSGMDLTQARVGERWRIGTVELRVTGPRIPCFKLAAVMDDPGFVRRFARAGRPGAYLSIARAGELSAGDRIEPLSRPEHGVTVGMVSTATLLDPSLLPALEAGRADFTPQLAAWVERGSRTSRF
ncbi:MAG: MOSC domain-containing protein [Solirubrobacterales bacterium]|jgi:MOSC domain-containing protein YiiM|nr:MOSC domain-containing protein [Solirubrobacterales bacterium]